jgi:hypothetical protein
MQIRTSDTGQTRFQNGIFVEPFNNHELTDVYDKNWYNSIDSARSVMRPYYVQWNNDFIFDSVKSAPNVVKHGDLVMLAHTSSIYKTQQAYASRYRNVTEGNIGLFVGSVSLDPPGNYQPDVTKPVDITTNVDLASNWTALAKAWGTQWGNWETVSTSYQDTLLSASSTTSDRVSTDPGYTSSAALIPSGTFF